MKNLLKIYKFKYFIPFLLLLSSCSSFYDNSPSVLNINDQFSAIDKSPSRSIDYFFGQNSNYLICAAPPPDAGFSQSEGGNFNFTLINFGNASEAGSQDTSSGDREMAGRTPAVVLARELLYRTCELSVNYRLNKQEAKSLFQETLKVINDNWSKEASKTTVSIGEKSSFSEDVNKGISVSASASATPSEGSAIPANNSDGSANEQSAPQTSATGSDSVQ